MKLGMEKQALRVKSEDTCHVSLWTLMPSVTRREREGLDFPRKKW